MSLFSFLSRLSGIPRRRKRNNWPHGSWPWVVACTALAFMSILLAGCSGNSSAAGSSSTAAATPTAVPQVALTQLKWCSAQSEVFRDQASSHPEGGASSTSNSQLGPANGTPKAISDWNTFKASMGFTLYLPSTLPQGSCLLSVSGSLRDSVFGSNFTITYILPTHDAISFSEAPFHSQTLTFQCNVSQSGVAATTDQSTATATASATATVTDVTATAAAAATGTATSSNPLQLCNGLRDKTNVVFSAHGQTAALKQLFQNLQSGVDWTPAQ